MKKVKYLEPIVTRIKLDPDQAVIAACTATPGHVVTGQCHARGASWRTSCFAPCPQRPVMGESCTTSYDSTLTS